ncbi:aldehyde dehydrogenase family protein [Floricoccus penangensis]|uniref:aldehyde dehydrogenase family protein n=1 Tax=Floricoccus penangensis TaxID=1859475 RepID=UPI00203AC2D6|nr:aldehyde dehydrogenase family protein [Floricoccus penangensis]URZ88401.1 aldehyde dehydrogenase family protein [Floricoccus penangensis]
MGKYQTLVDEQRKFFLSNQTKSYNYRVEQLNKLEKAIKKFSSLIDDAMMKDLNKPKSEVEIFETGFALNYLSYVRENLKDWMTVNVMDSSNIFPNSTSTIYSDPYGVMLIIAPYNYPIMLTMLPLIDAIMTGNTAIVKPSELAPETSKVIDNLISETFEKKYIALVEGGQEETTELLSERLDYIFFTGSPRVAKIIMGEASKNLTPITLELGGKSPAIVIKDTNINEAAKKILWSKLINSGQTCVATDYILVDTEIKKELIKELEKEIINFYGKDPITSTDYCKTVNKKSFDRLKDLLDKSNGTVIFGGEFNEKELKISPTIVENVDWSDSLMSQELFGPIIPIIDFNGNMLDEQVIKPLNDNEKPLALYLYTNDEEVQKKVISQVSFGGGVINGAIAHALNLEMPFAGVGNSGLGQYHGKFSFDEFTHKKSVLNLPSDTSFEPFYPPYK